MTDFNKGGRPPLIDRCDHCVKVRFNNREGNFHQAAYLWKAVPGAHHRQIACRILRKTL